MGLREASFRTPGSDLGPVSGPERQDHEAKMDKVENTDVMFFVFETIDLCQASKGPGGLLTVSVGQQMIG